VNSLVKEAAKENGVVVEVLKTPVPVQSSQEVSAYWLYRSIIIMILELLTCMSFS